MFRKLTDWFFAPELPPKRKYRYVAPDDAVNVGPVLDGWPAYLRIWHEKATGRLKFEFRNMPRAVVIMDARIIPDLIKALEELDKRSFSESSST